MLTNNRQKNSDSHFMEIKAENISFSYNGNKILDKLNFSISTGDRKVITGDVGCGKSTFILILSGLIKPSTGKVQIIPCLNLKYEVLQKTGILRQNLKSQILFQTSQRELFFGLENSTLEQSKAMEKYKRMIDQWNIDITQRTSALNYFQILKLLTVSIILSGKKFIFFDEILIHLRKDEREMFLLLLENEDLSYMFVTQHPFFFPEDFKFNIMKNKSIASFKIEESYVNRNFPLSNNLRGLYRINNSKRIKSLLKRLNKKKIKYSFLPYSSENLFFFPTIGQEIKWNGISRNRFIEELNKTGLDDHLIDRNPMTLSGGERRKVITIISFLKDPQILIIENPALYMDSESRIWLFQTFKKFIADAKIIFYTIPDEHLFYI